MTSTAASDHGGAQPATGRRRRTGTRRRGRPRFVAVLVRALLLPALLTACTDGPSGADATTTERSAVASSSPADSRVPAACAPFAERRLTAFRAELDRLASVPLEELVTNDAAADLSDDYYVAAAQLDADAAAGGCTDAQLATAVLDRVGELRTGGPIAASAKASFVDDNAWRVARALDGGARGSIIVSGPALTPPTEADLTDCTAVAEGWRRVIAAMAAALEGVPLDEYLALSDVRSVDARNLAAASEPIGFDIPGLQATADAVSAASDRLACTDDAVAAVLLDRLPAVATESPAASIFLADQVDLALLLVLGF